MIKFKILKYNLTLKFSLIGSSILLSIGRAILRIQEKEKRTIDDTEVKGFAFMLQGRYKFVPSNESDKFANNILSAFKYVQEIKVSSISKLAYASFQKDEFLGNSILDEELIQELTAHGYAIA